MPCQEGLWYVGVCAVVFCDEVLGQMDVGGILLGIWPLRLGTRG